MSRSTGLLVSDENGALTSDAAPLHVEHEQMDYHSSSPTALPTTTATANSDVVEPYLRSRDFKELIACVIFAVICFVVATITDASTTERPIPYQLLNTGEYVRNLSFNERFDGETVPDSLLIVLAIVIPWILQMLISIVYGEKVARHATLCIYFVALSLTQLTTDLIKMYCGYLRPIFYTICEPDETYETCTGDSESYRRSFPSGHASTSFCGLTLLTLFLHSQFGVPSMKRKLALTRNDNVDAHQSNSDTIVPLRYRCISILSLAPMGVAFFIAASRVVDNKHFPADVTAGSILGAAIANFVHGLWF
jgi:diacylglycerol diphosphate phosphatase / phosphatidate phosphatase